MQLDTAAPEGAADADVNKIFDELENYGKEARLPPNFFRSMRNLVTSPESLHPREVKEKFLSILNKRFNEDVRTAMQSHDGLVNHGGMALPANLWYQPAIDSSRNIVTAMYQLRSSGALEIDSNNKGRNQATTNLISNYNIH